MPLNQDVGKGRKHAYMEVSSRAAQEAKAEERKLCRTNICHTSCTFAACVFPTQAAYDRHGDVHGRTNTAGAGCAGAVRRKCRYCRSIYLPVHPCTFAACVFPTQAAYSTSMYIKKRAPKRP
ncbi:MAG: hypothetical protein HW411_613 [Gammaproteobacteria bacterium]|nr:hypothetical protein [Gammaproteobacteria bacterium]